MNNELKTIDLTSPTGAIFSDDWRHRYILWRLWSQSRPLMGQVGLNPSTANSTHNDPTIKRSMTRANNAGYGGLIMVNLYSLISTDPKLLLKNEHSVDKMTNLYISAMVNITDRQLCMWGSFKEAKHRAASVYDMLKNPYCLGLNSDGEPKHSLYVSYDVKMKVYKREEYNADKQSLPK